MPPTEYEYQMFGLPAALVLRDEDGEFEVINAFGPIRGTYSTEVRNARVQDAIQARRADKPDGKRPRY